MKNLELYEKLYELEKQNLYSVTYKGFVNHMGVNETKYDKDRAFMYLERKKIGLKQYMKFREEKDSWFKNEGKSKKKEERRFVADFETIGEEQSEKEKTARVWAGCIMNVKNRDEYTITNNIDDFMDNVKQLRTGIIYFHNLKFDGSYILNYFNKLGIEYVEPDKGRRGTFSCHIANGLYYSITWYLSDKRDNKHGQDKITFIDSLKILPTSIKELGNSFKDRLNGIGKIEEDQAFYDEFRPLGHEITEREKEYLLQDCRVMAVALEYMIYELGHKKMTMAGNALTDFEKRFNEDRKNILFGEISPEDNFKQHFPELPMGELDEDDNVDDKGNGWNTWIMKAYRGGYTYVMPKRRAAEIKQGIVYDVNSLYPFIMYTKVLPYGKPKWFDGEYRNIDNEDKKEYPLYIQKVKVQFELKEGFLPTIPDDTKGRKNADYLQHSNSKKMTLYLTNIDLELFKKHHNIIGKIEYIGGYMFKGKRGIFKEYIDYWMNVKKNSNDDPAMRYIAKLFLNSLYGKFASRWDKPASRPKFSNGVLSFEKKNKWLDTPIELQDKAYHDQVKYPAMAVFITSYARELTIQSAQNNYERFCYADTDSLHLEGIEPAKDIQIDHDNTGDIGLWKKESVFESAKFIRAKTYIENVYEKEVWNEKEQKYKYKACEPEEATRTKLHVTVAGMSKDCHKHVTVENFGDYEEGTPLVSGNKGVYEGNKRTKMFPGGLVVCTGLYVLRAMGGSFKK